MMQWLSGDRLFYDVLSKDSLVTIIELRIHPYITELCSSVHDYFLDNPYIEDLSPNESMLLQTQFKQVEKELNSVFKKETGNLFPCLRKNVAEPERCFQETTMESIQAA